MPVNDQQETDPLYEGVMLHPKKFPDALIGNVQGPNQSLPLIEHNRGEMLNICIGSGEHSNILQGTDGKFEAGEEQKEISCKRLKWTVDMVKLLITALSYVGEDDVAVPRFKCENGRFLSSPKLGKWRAISYVMVQRGYNVRPHQCEDKFNDLNKKFRRLNELLGRGTACQVVENPKLIESMDLSNEAVVEVTKILSCRQLFYEEMCSYNNRNRLFLPHDQSVKSSVKLALKGKDNFSQDVSREISEKGLKEAEDHGVAGSNSTLDCNRRSEYFSSEGEKLTNKRMKCCSLHLEEQKLKIEEQRLELEKFLLERQQEDLELEKMRMENKVMKLDNQRLALKIRQQMSKRKVFCGKRGRDDPSHEQD